MKEKAIEQHLVKSVKCMGGITIKLISPSMDGLPDRLVLLPEGKMAFIELKAPKEKLRPLQVKRKGQLELLGFSVYCIYSIEGIGGILDEIQSS